MESVTFSETICYLVLEYLYRFLDIKSMPITPCEKTKENFIKDVRSHVNEFKIYPIM